MSAHSTDDESLVSETNKLTVLQKDIDDLSSRLTGVILNNSVLNKRLNELTDEYYSLYEKLDELDMYIVNLDQYSRRNNIELRNIPENITSLETHVINVLASIDITVNSYDIVAVHRLGKPNKNYTRSVIVRFVNRKFAYSALEKSKKLNKSNNKEYKRIFITENLCPTNRNIFNHLYKLKKESKINNVWTFNGSVFFKLTDNKNERSKKIKYIDEIDEYIEVNEDDEF